MNIKHITKSIFVGIMMISFFVVPVFSTYAAGYVYTYTFNGEIKFQPFPDRASCEQKMSDMMQYNQISGTCTETQTAPTGFYCYQANQNLSTNLNVQVTCFPAAQQQQCEQQRANDSKNLDSGCWYSTTNKTGVINIQNPNSSNTNTGEYTLLAPLVKENNTPVNKADFPTYMRVMFQVAISLASVIAVLMIVYGGVTYMTTDNFSQKQQGKEIIQRTLFGIALIITCWVLLYTINPNLVNFGNTNQSIDEVNNTASSTPVKTGNGLSSARDAQLAPPPLTDHKPPQGQTREDYDYGATDYNFDTQTPGTRPPENENPI